MDFPATVISRELLMQRRGILPPTYTFLKFSIIVNAMSYF